MAPDVDEALLSAYLDGEVTAEERRRVEQLLANNAAWRQFYDELRALRGAFTALPRHQLGPDFTARLLRETERAPRGSTADRGLRIARPPDREKVRLRLPRHWRAWAWPAVAVAAALFMMLHPAEQPVRKLAEAPKQQAMPPNLDIGAAPAAKGAPSATALGLAEQDEAPAPVDSSREKPSSAPAGAAAPSSADVAAHSANQMTPLFKAARGMDATPAEPAAAAPAPAQDANLQRSADGVTRAEQNKQIAGDTPSPGSASAATPAGPAPAAPIPASMPLAANESAPGLGLADSPEAKHETPALARRKAGPMRARGANPSPLEEPLDAKVAARERQSIMAAKDVLVVELVAQPDTAGQDALEQLLARHGIAKLALFNEEADQKPEVSADKTKKAADLSAGKAMTTSAGEMEIEASREQIEAALAELRQRVDEFTSVSVQPAAGSILQQPLAAYSRDSAPVSASAAKNGKAKSGRPAKSPASGGVGGLAKDSLREPKAASKPSSAADGRAPAKQAPAQAVDSSAPTAPAADDRRMGESGKRSSAPSAKSGPEAGEDQTAPLRAVFVLRAAESMAAPAGDAPESK